MQGPYCFNLVRKAQFSKTKTKARHYDILWHVRMFILAHITAYLTDPRKVTGNKTSRVMSAKKQMPNPNFNCHTFSSNVQQVYYKNYHFADCGANGGQCKNDTDCVDPNAECVIEEGICGKICRCKALYYNEGCNDTCVLSKTYQFIIIKRA